VPGVVKLTLTSILRHPPLQISQWGSKFLLPLSSRERKKGDKFEIRFLTFDTALLAAQRFI